MLLRNVNVKQFWYNKKVMYKEISVDSVYDIIDKFDEEKRSDQNFCGSLFKEIHSFYEGNGRTAKILFINAPNMNLVKNLI